jgi:hypothetical protein
VGVANHPGAPWLRRDAILAEEDAGYDPAGYPDEELAVLGQLEDDLQLWLMAATTAQAPPSGR